MKKNCNLKKRITMVFRAINFVAEAYEWQYRKGHMQG
jgi:hypothetical protein